MSSGYTKAAVKIAPVAKDALRVRESPVKTWEDVADDPDRLEWLLYVANHYQELFNQVLFDCQQLTSHNRITYLIDFDVLRDYLEASAKKYESVFINSIFYESSQQYGIPAGAFEELLEYLADINLKARSLLTPGILSRSDSIRHIAHTLGVRESAGLEEGEAVEEISQRLDQKALSLTRLLNVLTDPRFIGVISDYDENDVRHLAEMLTSLPRRKHLRSKVDERDAMNIAIALKSIRDAKRHRNLNPDAQTSAYVLISKTLLVTDLPPLLQKFAEESDEDVRVSVEHMRNLCGMVGLDDKSLDLNMQVISHYFPVMHPRRVINAELLGVYENAGVALTSATELRNSFRKVTDHFTAKAAVLKSAGARNLYFKMNSQQDQGEIEATFKDIAQKMLTSKTGGIYYLEQWRATSASVDYAHRLQQGESIMPPRDNLGQKSTGLLELLGQVLQSLGDRSGFEYQTKVRPADDARPFGEIKIFEHFVADAQEPLLFGETYLRSEQNPSEFSHYALRWPVVCTLDDFTSCLDGFLLPTSRREGRAGIKGSDRLAFQKITEDSPMWEEGILIYVNNEPLGLSIESLLHERGRGLLSLERTASCLHDYLGREDFLIQQYRINTSFGDFVFDIEPAEGESKRYLTIISHLNLAPQVSVLYRATGIMLTMPDKLFSTLGDALQDFETIPQGDLGEESDER